jgi:hypothetical protein
MLITRRSFGRVMLSRDGRHDVFLGPEVPVDGPGAQPGLGYDVLHCRLIEAAPGEAGDRGIHDLAAP